MERANYCDVLADDMHVFWSKELSAIHLDSWRRGNTCLRCGEITLSLFLRFLYMVSWPPCFGPVVAQGIMVAMNSEGDLFTSW